MNGRKVKALLDSGASHSFVSTRAAAELIALGAQYQKCELPILQGCIRAGVARLKLVISIDIMFGGVHKLLPSEVVWVWDMGVELLLCHAVIHEESLSLAPMVPEDEILLEPFVKRTGPFQTGEGEALLLSHLQERSRNTLVSNLNVVATLSPPPGHRIHPERVSRFSGGNSCCAACQAALSDTHTKAPDQADQDARDDEPRMGAIRARLDRERKRRAQ